MTHDLTGKHVAFLVADKGTAKEALDGLVADWKKVFKEDGKIK